MTAPDPEVFELITSMEMPFGKHKGKILSNLPVSCFEWINRKGLQKGKSGFLIDLP